MKRFIYNLSFLFCCVVLSLSALIVLRRWSVEKDMAELYKVLPSTETLILGSSRAGCVFCDDENLGIQVFWHSGSPMFMTRARLLELRRRNDLSSVRTIAIDCDLSSLYFIRPDIATMQFTLQFPVAWRVWNDMQGVSKVSLLKSLVLPIAQTWDVEEEAPAVTNRWLDIPKGDRQKKLANRNVEGFDMDLMRVLLDELHKIRGLCIDEKIELVLYMSPLPSDHPERKCFAAMRFADVLRDDGFTLIDLSDKARDDMFMDDDHLHWSARREFTKEYTMCLK